MYAACIKFWLIVVFDGSENDAHVCIVVGNVVQKILWLQRGNPSSTIILESRESVGCLRQMVYCLLIYWQGRLFMRCAQIAKRLPPKTVEKQRLRCQPDRSSTTNCALKTVGGPILLVCYPFEAMNTSWLPSTIIINRGGCFGSAIVTK